MTLARGSAHALVLLLLAGCGGSDVPPKTPAAPPPAPAPPRPKVDHDAACNELLIGARALTTALKGHSQMSAAGRLRTRQIVSEHATELRVQVKRAVELDPALAVEADALDKAIAPLIPRLDRESKIIADDAKVLRDIVFDTEKLAAPFVVSGPCPKTDADCEARRQVDSAMLKLGWTPTAIEGVKADVARASFKSADLEAKKAQLLQKLTQGANALVDEDRALESTDPDRKQKGAAKDLKKLAEKLYGKCGLKEADLGKGDFAMHRPTWVTSDAPDLRKMTMVVRVLPEGRIKTKLEDWADKSIGQVADAYEGASRGGFGSGFFVMPRPGDLYVVTNRHVVDFGDEATLMMQDGTALGAEILYVDPTADLAVLRPKPPKDKPLDVTYGLGLDATPAKDQQVVIATGYPGLAARPSYQTTRGYVSNERFVDPWDGNTYIQHTAPVDKGGSGGPLTSEKSLVLGVNTLKITGRENVAMSVPAAQVLDAVNHAMREAPDAETLRKEASAACLEVIAQASSFGRSSELYQLVSLGMIAERGAEAYNAVFDRQLEELLYESPIDALRAAVAAKMQRDARWASLNPYELCQNPDPDDMEHILTMDRVRFHVRAGAETKDLVLRREFGVFRVLRFDLVPAPKDEPKAAAKTTKKKPPAKKK